MTYFDDTKGEKYIPYVIEPSLGADRVVLAFLCAAYDEENIGTEEKPDVRTVFHFHPALAPVKIGVLPLSKKLNEGAEKVYAQLAKKYNCEFDDRGTIGKRYRRQDEIVHHSVLPMILIPKRMEPLPYVTVTLCSRKELKSMSWMHILRKNLNFNIA